MTSTSFNIDQQLTSVRLCATENLAGIYYNGKLGNGVGATLTASNVGSLSVDGVNVQLNDRILLSSQTNSNENGIYVVISAGSSVGLWKLQRSNDFQSIEQMKAGQYFSVDTGNTLSGNMIVLTEPLPQYLGLSGSQGPSFINVATGGGTPGKFLRIANNLSDVSNKQDSFINLGLGSGNAILLNDSDFSGGIYHLSNPCPNYINIACNTPGNSIYLPSAFSGDPGVFSLSQGPFINILPGFQSVQAFTAGGNLLLTLDSPSNTHFVSTGNSSDDGDWAFFEYLNSLNGISGRVNLVAGDNITIDNSGEGDLTISSTGGTGPITSGQTSFVVNENSVETTFGSPGATTPIIIDPASFSSIIASNFSNFVTSANTPTSTLLETGPRKILANVNLSYKMNTGSQNTFVFYLVIRTSPSSITTTTYQILSSVTPLSSGLISATLSGILPMNTNDSIEIWVTNSGGTDPLQIVDMSFQAVDLTQQGYASTDQLAQGTNNFYLTQNGGSTYQNVTGTPVTVGNYAIFSSTGGQLQDLGLQAGNANKIATTASTSSASFFPLFVPSTSNSYQLVNLSSSNLSFVPSTGILSSLGYVGNSLTSISGTDLTLTNQSPASNVNANNLIITAASGNGATASNGGNVNITSGSGVGSSGGEGGSINITAGNATAGALAGNIAIIAGQSSSEGGSTSILGGNGSGSNAAGGSASIAGGTGTGTSQGGPVYINGGTGPNSGTGGDVIIVGGNSGTTSTAGNLRLRGGSASSGTQGKVIFDQGAVNINTTLSVPSANAVTIGTITQNTLTINAATGTNNRADLILNRFDSTNGFCRTIFNTAGANGWSNGMRSATTNYTIFDETNSVAQLTLVAGSGTTGSATFAGDLSASGNFSMNTATKAVKLKSAAVSAGSANAFMVTGCVLVAGTVTITNASITSSHRGLPMLHTVGGTVGAWYVTCGSGTFTITSTSNTDTSTLDVWFVLPN